MLAKPLNLMVLLIIIPFLNGYVIGNINPIFRQTHVQHVNYVTQGTLRHPKLLSSILEPLFSQTFIFQIRNPSKGSWMAHLKISNLPRAAYQPHAGNIHVLGVLQVQKHPCNNYDIGIHVLINDHKQDYWSFVLSWLSCMWWKQGFIWWNSGPEIQKYGDSKWMQWNIQPLRGNIWGPIPGLVNIQKAIEHGDLVHGFTHEKYWFSIAVCSFTRG